MAIISISQASDFIEDVSGGSWMGEYTLAMQTDQRACLEEGLVSLDLQSSRPRVFPSEKQCVYNGVVSFKEN